MLRSPWLWITVVLIVAGVAVTTALGMLPWLIALLGAIALLNLGAFLYAAYAVGRAEPPSLPSLEPVPDEDRIPLVYDCDLTMGRPFRSVGDGLALLYLLGEPKIDLRAVTTTYGNGPVRVTTRTTRQLLNELNLDHIPVAGGASGPEEDPSENEAARFLAEAVEAAPDEIVVLATGAMTNLKHASLLHPDFFQDLRSLHLVGGVLGELTWNQRRLAERNFSRDPEAAYAVIQSDCPTTITPGEAGLTAIFRGPQFAALQSLKGSVPRLITRRIRFWFGLMRFWFRDDGFPMWESIAALAITHPELFEFQRAHVPVTIEDLRTGRLVLDPTRVGPVRFVEGVRDYANFININLAAWQHLSQRVEGRDPPPAPGADATPEHGGPDTEERDTP